MVDLISLCLSGRPCYSEPVKNLTGCRSSLNILQMYVFACLQGVREQNNTAHMTLEPVVG